MSKQSSPKRKSKTDLARLDAQRDRDIVIDDDAPELPADFWDNAKLFVPPKPKEQVSMRLDGDTLAWFKDQGKGYQQHMAFALRSYVEQAKKAGVRRVKGSAAKRVKQ